MKHLLIYFSIFLLTTNCSNDNSSQQIIEKKENLKSVLGLENDTLMRFSDTAKNEENRIQNKKTKTDIFDFTETLEVKTSQDEMEIINLRFLKQLDSLIKFEKRCLTSTLKGLHWTFFKISENTYELTASSDFGGTYIGYVIIDSSLVFISPEEPDLYRRTERKKKFTFYNKRFPHFEDYSVWIFKFEGNKMKITESFTLPCD